MITTTIRCGVFTLLSKEPTTHHCIIHTKSGWRRPMAGGEARRAQKEGKECRYIYVYSNKNPEVGDYVNDGGAIFGPYEEGDTILDFRGVVIGTTDPELGLPRLSETFIKDFINLQPCGVKVLTDMMFNPIVENGELVIKLDKSLWTIDELGPLFLEVMNLGMSLRQDQLNGVTSHSGNEALAEWMNRRL